MSIAIKYIMTERFALPMVMIDRYAFPLIMDNLEISSIIDAISEYMRHSTALDGYESYALNDLNYVDPLTLGFLDPYRLGEISSSRESETN